MSGKRCIIVGGGDFEPNLLPARETDDLLIAADSGYAALEKIGVKAIVSNFFDVFAQVLHLLTRIIYR